MASEVFEWADKQLEDIVAGWNIYSTALCIVLGLYLIYPIFFSTEPDTHPFLIARQSTVSRVRQPGESTVYRALETPHGYPLRTGLNVKDPGAPKWSSGRDGDLRDIWRRATTGKPGEDGKPTENIGKMYTVLGKEDVLEHSFEKLSAELNAIGKHLKAHGGSRVAIYLSNSPEFVVALFATLFYGLTPILISSEQSLERLATILKKTEADTLIVGAGSVPLKDLSKQYDGLNEVVWVVPKSSRHVDWNEVPEGEGGKAEVAVWHDIVDEDGSNSSSQLPTNDDNSQISDVIIVSPPTNNLSHYEIVGYTQKNLTAAISAQLSSLPYAHRFASSDLLLPLIPLTNTYALTITLGALFTNASVALTAVTGKSAKYSSAFSGQPQISPTIILADPSTLYTYELHHRSNLRSGFLRQLLHDRVLSSIKSTGSMPRRSSSAPSGEDTVRLIYTNNVMYPGALANLRVFTGSRVVVGLTHPKVAGAISQTHMLDYNASELSDAHFGPPLSSVEIKLIETAGHSVDDSDDSLPEGKLSVSGPAVVGPEGTELVVDQVFSITDSCTIGVVSNAAGGHKEEISPELTHAVLAKAGLNESGQRPVSDTK